MSPTTEHINVCGHWEFYCAKYAPVKIPRGATAVMECQPPTHSYHYNYPESQGALMAQTSNWVGFYWPAKQELHCAYSDRLQSWDGKRYARLCKQMGTGEQGWARVLQGMSDEDMRKAAQIAFDLPTLPDQVRFVHHYNVSSGYSCPTIEAICAKAETKKEAVNG